MMRKFEQNYTLMSCACAQAQTQAQTQDTDTNTTQNTHQKTTTHSRAKTTTMQHTTLANPITNQTKKPIMTSNITGRSGGGVEEEVEVEVEAEVEVEVNAASRSPETTCGLLTFKDAAIRRNLSLNN